jgi:hypothetical protein
MEFLQPFLGKRGQKESSSKKTGMWALSLPVQDLDNTSPPQYPFISPMTEYFFDGTNDVTIFPPAVSIEPVEVDFGACPGPKPSNPVPLCLMNHTKGKITVVWKRRSDCPFWVTPDTCDVPPLKSMAMRLHFQPSCPNSLYAVELEAFAVYKVCACRPVEVGRHVLCWTLKGGVELQGVTEGTAGPGFSYIFLGWMVPPPPLATGFTLSGS